MKTYKINLLSDVKERWLPIIKNEKSNAKRLVEDSARKMIFPGAFTPIIKMLYEAIGGKFEYANDIRTIAELLKVDKGDVICGNLEYELTTCLLRIPFACTAAAFYKPGHGMIHIRNLDWPGKHIGEYTIKVVYNSRCGEFTAITWPGFVGIMSAVAKNRFSATINWLPWPPSIFLPNFLPKPNLFGWPASFLLRYIFENCKTFEAALKTIRTTKVVSPVLITLVGTEKGQAIAIERGTNDYRIRNFKEPALVSTNHSIKDEKYRAKDKLREDATNNYTYKRKFIIEERIDNIKISKLSDAFRLLNYKTVFNGCTAQSMVLSVKTGKALIRTYEQ